MARARNIKPSFFINEELVELPFATRLLFIGLWTIADREGRLEDKPKKIKMGIFPADDVDVNAALDDLHKAGLILRYENGADKFIQIISFTKHQNPHRDEKASLIPAPVEHGANTVQAPCNNDANTVAIGLNPESFNLNPESPSTAQPSGAVALSIAFRKHGIKTQPADPRLIALADQGVTVETVEAACEAAKQTKPDETIGLGYVLKIIERWAKEAGSIKAKGASAPKATWWSTDQLILAKATELGTSPRLGETMPQLKSRLQAMIDNGGVAPVIRQSMVVEKPAEAIRSVMPEGLNLKALVRQSA